MANQKKKNAAKKRLKNARASRRQHCWWALPVSFLMAVVLIVAAFLTVHEVDEYRKFRVMCDTVKAETFYDGIVVDNYDVSGVTLDEALRHWAEVIEGPYVRRSVTLTYGEKKWTIDAETLGYSSNYADVLREAWQRGRTGTLEERYRTISKIRANPERYEIQRAEISAEDLRRWTDDIAQSLTVVPKNANVEGFDVNTHEFTFSAASVGYTVDADELYSQTYQAFVAGGGSVEIEVEELDPTIVAEGVKDRYGMITQAVTNASSSNSSRLTNLRLACAAINGYCVQPGETFSFNEVVGPRTKARGYQIATVYQSGELAEDIGGGVCQVSTTLWNAAMKANCEIVERHEHSRPVAYVDRGKDATVSYGSQDMKFKNTSSSPMYIVAYVSSNKRVYCEIYGELFPDGKYITIEAKTTQKIEPGEPTYTYNPLLDAGTTRTITEARTGYRAEAYRVYWNGDGTEIKRELLCQSYYKPARGEIEYG